MKKLILTLFCLSFLISCQPDGRSFIEHQELSPEVEWLKKDTRTFKVLVEDKSKNYNLSLSFRYVNGYQFQVLKVKMTETSPSGKVQEYNHDLKVISDKGEYLGEPGYDIWDSEHLVQPNKNYEEKGEYTYTLEHNMPVDPIILVMEIGVILDEVATE
jgi:gliding motility-associated lipoprotein GldH